MSQSSIISIARLLELSDVEDENIALSPEKASEGTASSTGTITTSRIESVASLKELVEVLDATSQPSSREEKAVLTSAISFKVSELLAKDIGSIVSENLNSVIAEEVEKIASTVKDTEGLAEVSEHITDADLDKALTKSINERLSQIAFSKIQDEIENLEVSQVLSSEPDTTDSLESFSLTSSTEIEHSLDSINLGNLQDKGIEESAEYILKKGNDTDTMSSGTIGKTVAVENAISDTSIESIKDATASVSGAEKSSGKETIVTNSKKTDTNYIDGNNSVLDGSFNMIPNLVSIFTENKIGALVRDLLNVTALKENFIAGVNRTARETMETLYAESVSKALGVIPDKAVDYTDAIARDVMNFDITGFTEDLIDAFKKYEKENLKLSTDFEYDTGYAFRGSLMISENKLVGYSSKLPSRSDLFRDSWWLDNQYNWTVTISIPNDTLASYGLPSMNMIIGMDKDTDDSNKAVILPIKTYSLDDSDLTYMTVPLNDETMDILSTRVTHPTSISITIPVTTSYGTLANNYLAWQNRYVDYVKGHVEGDTDYKYLGRYSMIARDYRECYYNLTINKIRINSERDTELVAYRKFRVLPVVSLNDSGLSTKTYSEATILFKIVGEDKTGTN